MKKLTCFIFLSREICAHKFIHYLKNAYNFDCWLFLKAYILHFKSVL